MRRRVGATAPRRHEGRLLRELVRSVPHPAYSVRQTGVGAAGAPDVVISHAGRTIWLEAKVGGAQLTPIQAIARDEIEAAGGRHVLARFLVAEGGASLCDCIIHDAGCSPRVWTVQMTRLTGGLWRGVDALFR